MKEKFSKDSESKNKKCTKILPASVYDIPPNTTTITVSTNWLVNTSLLFHKLPITKIERPPKKKDLNNLKLPPGTIISAKIKDDNKVVHIRGICFTEGCFPNSVCIVMYVSKRISIKIPQQGKLQITGCKSPKDLHKIVQYIWKYMMTIERRREEWKLLAELAGQPLDYLESPTVSTRNGDAPTAIFHTVMNNVSFNIGFKVDRKKIYNYIYSHTDMIPIPEMNLGYSGVIVKLPVKDMSNTKFIRYRYIEDGLGGGKWYSSYVSWDQYLEFIPKKDKDEELKKERFHSFLIFHTGNVIQSSPSYIEMGEVYDYFVGIVKEARDKFEAFEKTPGKKDWLSDGKKEGRGEKTDKGERVFAKKPIS